MSPDHKPRVLFVCVSNSGKSPMATGLMRRFAGDSVDVASAGTRPKSVLNSESVRALAEIGVDITGESPKPLTPTMVSNADIVITLGRDATVEPVANTAVRNWDTDEPSERGIEGMERMRLIRDDIARRTRELAAELAMPPEPAP